MDLLALLEQFGREMGITQQGFLKISLYLSKLLIVFGPAIPYIPQHIENTQTNTAEGFSLYVSLISVTSACIKMAYWFGREYEFAMFLQNLVTIFTVMVMIDQHLAIENRRLNRSFDERNFVDFDIKYFWKWTNLISYVQATGYFLIVICGFSAILAWMPHYFDFLALAVIVLDSSVSLPQLWRNYSRQTTYGLNKSMVSMWNFFDVYKLLYMITASSPWPFKVNGIIQLMVDSGVMAQIFYYGDHPRRE